MKARQKGKCLLCIHKKNVGDYGRLQCCHPIVMEIGEKYPERKPGVIAATALNKMGKVLKLKVHPDAYMSDRWFNWPWCYYPRRPSIVACSGFEGEPKVKVDKARHLGVVGIVKHKDEEYFDPPKRVLTTLEISARIIYLVTLANERKREMEDKEDESEQNAR